MSGTELRQTGFGTRLNTVDLIEKVWLLFMADLDRRYLIPGVSLGGSLLLYASLRKIPLNESVKKARE